MKYQIELADIFKAFVKSLDKYLYEVEYAELTLARVDTEDKVESGVMTIDEFKIWATNKSLI